MTILMILSGWVLLVALILRFFGYVHECDEEIRKPMRGRQLGVWRESPARYRPDTPVEPRGTSFARKSLR